MDTPTFKIGEKVSKVGGDYRFDGTVVAAFNKLSGLVRYVVEDDRGALHVYSDKNLSSRTDDWTHGEVIAAYADGTIVLDDGMNVHNPTRALQFIAAGGTLSKDR